MKKIIFVVLFLFLNLNVFALENSNLIDISDGNDNAKIKIYTYQSLTCPHCATFHNEIYPLLKRDFIDKGILKIYFRHFTLDLASLNAAKIVQCVDGEKKIPFLDHLYKTQEKWTKGEKIEDINNNLKIALNDFGLTGIDLDKCLKIKDLEDYILNTRIEGSQDFEIKSTPTIIINDKKFEGNLEYKDLKKAIEKLI